MDFGIADITCQSYYHDISDGVCILPLVVDRCGTIRFYVGSVVFFLFGIKMAGSFCDGIYHRFHVDVFATFLRDRIYVNFL